jgi:RNA polymerase sigma-70 factor (sigma-E family)
MDQDEDFAAYVDARWSTLVRSAVFLGCSVEDAHDIVQVALIRCYGRWRRIQATENPDAYIYRVLVNCLKDSRRRKWWGERPTRDVPERLAMDGAELVAMTDAVHRALADLSEKARAVVVLRYFAHLSDQEAADVLGVPLGTVKSRLSRAHAQLTTNIHLTEFAEGTL